MNSTRSVIIMINSTNTTTSKSSPRDGVWWFGQIFPIIIILLGVIGNSIVIHILSKRKYSQTSTCYYMKALSWSDNFVMFLLFVRWFSKIPNSPMTRDTYFCVLYFFAVRLGFGVSTWVLMFMTIDRFIAIRLPLKAKSLCTIFRTKLMLVMIILVHIVSHFPYFWRYSNPHALTLSEQCPYALPKRFATIYQILRMVLFDRLLPWLCTLGFTIAITEMLRKSVKENQKIFNSSQNKKFSQRVSIMSLSVAWMFFILTFPTTIFELIRVITKLNMPPFLYELFVYFLYLNSAINFYLYLIVAKAFREEFKCVILKILRRPVKRKSDLSTSSTPGTTCSGSVVTIESMDAAKITRSSEKIANIHYEYDTAM